MERRHLLAAFGAVAATWPLSARRSRDGRRWSAFLSGTAPELYAPFVAAFREALAGAGFVEHKTVEIEYRWARGDFDRLPALADELVHRKVDVLVTSGGSIAALAAKRATDAIPIVLSPATIRLRSALYRALRIRVETARGSAFSSSISTRSGWGCCRRWCRRPRRWRLMVNPKNQPAANRIVSAAEVAARERGLVLDIRMAGSEAEIDAAFAALAERHTGALLIGNDAYYNSERARFIGLATRYAMPAIYEFKAVSSRPAGCSATAPASPRSITSLASTRQKS